MRTKIVGISIATLLFAASAFAQATEVKVSVKGMVCAFCAQGITKKFNAQPAVEKVKVSLEKKLVDLTLKDGQNITDDAIKSILSEAGYNVEKVERHSL